MAVLQGTPGQVLRGGRLDYTDVEGILGPKIAPRWVRSAWETRPRRRAAKPVASVSVRQKGLLGLVSVAFGAQPLEAGQST
ncbi:hypothetical protein KFL_002470140 [Klebsormidium nitens]|uniref:Uncharacterized protein n=1 Tax=Klebsormidium nitens TaxID=105231 RepID=A0A1Y1I3Z0_KLENI|nr:hypothetical protein KFL_002470140 [Klebsormidium nitens]|eukprot:GAQ85655.1 hypothetical protein KFL_002470140 [Klebsormidium nitens]